MAEEELGILDVKGISNNPINGKPYSDIYKETAQYWSKLPAYQLRHDILKSLHENQLLFIISGTGSGKTVLMPKYALHYTQYQGNVIVSLPKRKVALSSATYAAVTLDVALGEEVGYKYKGSPPEMFGEKNKIQYVTDGTLIMQLIEDPFLTNYKVIVVDEAHERKVQIDMLLLFLKKILQSGKRPDLRVIIMSATIDGEKYQKYFGKVKSTIINISGKPNYPIEVKFLQNPISDFKQAGMKVMDEIVEKGEDMLFFVTTKGETVDLCRTVRKKYPQIYCLELHADMNEEAGQLAESKNKYKELGNYTQKMLIATNVAESSITIEGLKNVIDSCYELYSYYDPIYMADVLEKRLITKAQALQRRGRVGRTEPGTCYHLITQNQFELLKDYPDPDILTQDITMDLLKIIQFTPTKKFSDGLDLLKQLMDIPDEKYIKVSHEVMKLYELIDENEILTPYGDIVLKFSSLPINLTMFMIYGYQLKCASEVCAIVTMIEMSKSNITNLFEKNQKININTFISKWSDHFTLLNLFNGYYEAEERKKFAYKYKLKYRQMEKIKNQKFNYFKKIQELFREKDLLVENFEGSSEDRILRALELSHQDRVAKDMVPTFPRRKMKGNISQHSMTSKPKGANQFIYDRFMSITNSWEFMTVTYI